MKRIRSVWYEICVPGSWWGGKKLGWVTSEELEHITGYGSVGSHRLMLKSDKAFRHFSGLPSGSILIKWYYKKGVIYMQEFKKQEPTMT